MTASINDIISAISSQQFIRKVCPLPFSEEEVEKILITAIDTQIRNRGGKMILSQSLSDSIKNIAKWLAYMNKPSLFLCGNVGNGKTTIVKAIQNIYQLLDVRDWKNQKVGFSIVPARLICNYWKTDYKNYRTLLDESMIAVDDLGTEPKEMLDYGNIGNPIIELFEYRYDKQLTTIVTSNLTSKQIREDYCERIADRFNEMMCVVPFTDTSYRGKNDTIEQSQPTKPQEKTQESQTMTYAEYKALMEKEK